MGWPIRTVSLEAFDGAFARNSFGPAIELAEVAFLGEGDGIVVGNVWFQCWQLFTLGYAGIFLCKRRSQGKGGVYY